jgi:hypothetical protein
MTKTLFEFIITKLGLSDGDIIDVSEQDGKQIIMPAENIQKKKFTLADTHTPDGKPKRMIVPKKPNIWRLLMIYADR